METELSTLRTDLSITRAQLSTAQADCANLRESSTEMQSAYSSLSTAHASAIATTQVQAEEISALREIISGMETGSGNIDNSRNHGLSSHNPALVVPSLDLHPYGARANHPLDKSLSFVSSETEHVSRCSPGQNTSHPSFPSVSLPPSENGQPIPEPGKVTA